MIEIKSHLKVIMDDIIDLRKQLHQIPELKFEEFQTSELISHTLMTYGYENQVKIATTGIVAMLDTGRPGKTIALRADMDALPLPEPEANEPCSKHPGKMHACGHDGHTATLLAVAYVLSQVKEQLCGKVKFIFQPAEEGGKGSTAMIEAGVLKNPNVDEIYAYHNWPGLAEGIIATRPGAILVGNGRIEIQVHGKQAHTAQPEKAINPVLIGAQLIQLLEGLKASINLDEVVFNLFSFNSGDYKRGMSEQVDIVGIYYIDTDAHLADLKTKFEKIIRDVAAKSGTKIDVTFTPFHSPTINTETETDKLIQAAKEILPAENVKILEKSMIASEDFSAYLSHVPGCFFLVGAGEQSKPVHTAEFQFNDDVISHAASVLCQTVIASLSRD